MQITPTRFSDHKNFVKNHLDQLKGKKLLVVGDIGLDEYVFGHVKRISPEAPVPVLEVQQEDRRMGLAANVAANVTSLGGEALLVGVIGADGAADELKALLQKMLVSPEHLVADGQRPTTRKMRVLSGHHHIVRVDFEQRRHLSEAIEKRLLERVLDLIPQSDGVVLEDYSKGVLSETVVQKIICYAHEKSKKVVVDPHRTTPLEYYKGADLFKPNHDEAHILSALSFDEIRKDSEALNKVAKKIINDIQCSHLIVTRGEEGMSLFSDHLRVDLPTYARQVFDVTGAGDTVLAALALGWFSGFNLQQSCVLANWAAGVVVGKVGCVPCSTEELLTYMARFNEPLST